ncbi:hypothetical protein CLOM_g91, partial [Closterium sp. NIES-68]
HW